MQCTSNGEENTDAVHGSRSRKGRVSVYIAGGSQDHFEALNTCEVYNHASNQRLAADVKSQYT